jgi:hypothetical protein
VKAVDNVEEYTIAEGPEGLTETLNELLEKSLKDPMFAVQEHFVLYKLGGQKSMIKIDTSQQPFRFWYYDLMGRPMTVSVKETIAKFLWEKCGEKERFTREESEKH